MAINALPSSRTAPKRRSGLTMVEVVVSMVIVAVLLAAALNTVGAVAMSRRTVTDRARAGGLAEDLMAEILDQAYEDPQSAPGTIGLEADEVANGNRALWDDVDDYNGWSASPPQQKAGTIIAGFEEWTRRVSVARVQLVNPTQTAGSDTGVKRITVTVLHGDKEAARLVALRTRVD